METASRNCISREQLAELMSAAIEALTRDRVTVTESESTSVTITPPAAEDASAQADAGAAAGESDAWDDIDQAAEDYGFTVDDGGDAA